MCLFIFENKFEHVTSNTQFRVAQIRVAPFMHIMLQVCHRGKSSHKCAVTLWNDCIYMKKSLRWRHNDHPAVSNHQPHGCLLNRLFRRRWKKTSKLRVTGLCAGNSPGPVNSPHKGPVTRKMFPFDDVIMNTENFITTLSIVLELSVKLVSHFSHIFMLRCLIS